MPIYIAFTQPSHPRVPTQDSIPVRSFKVDCLCVELIANLTRVSAIVLVDDDDGNLLVVPDDEHEDEVVDLQPCNYAS